MYHPSKNKYRLLLLLVLLPLFTFNQDHKANPYRLNIVSTMQEYRESCRKNRDNQLSDLQESIPGIRLDIRYATADNFTKKPVYTSAHAFLRLPAASALAGVQKELEASGLGLKVFDAYRPYAATLLFWDLIRDTLFVASPAKGSRHNRGCAVDVTLVDLKTGSELEMPTPYDEFSGAAAAGFQGATDRARANRELLIDMMARHGFRVMDSEWWHYDYQGWDQFGLMDVTFEELLNGS